MLTACRILLVDHGEGGGDWLLDAAQQAEERCRAVFDSVESSMVVLDKEGRIVSVNAAWQRFAHENPCADGQEPRHCGVGENYLGICRSSEGPSSEGAGEACRGIEDVLQGRRDRFQMEYPCHSKVQRRWFRMSVVALPDGEGVVVSHLDITALKEAELRSLELQAQFREMLDHSPDGTLLMDQEDGRIMFANRTFGRMLGYTPEEMTRLKVEDLHPPGVVPRWKEQRAQLNEKHGVRAKSVQVVGRDGRRLTGDIQLRGLELDGRPCVLETFHDRSALALAERRSRIQHKLVRSLASATRLRDGLRLCLEAAMQAEGMDCGGFYLMDPMTGALNLVEHQKLSEAFVQSTAQFGAETPQGRLVAGGVAFYGTVENLELGESARWLRQEGIRALAVVPMVDQGRMLGCMNLASRTHREVSASARQFMESIAASGAQAIARLRAEEALRQSRRLIEGVFNSVATHLAVLDGTGRIVTVNRAWERFASGHDEGGMSLAAGGGPGVNYLTVCRELGEQGCVEAWRAEEGIRSVMLGQQETFTLEHRVEVSGEVQWYQLTVTRLGDDGNGVVVAHANITGSKKAEEELRHRLDLQDQLAKVVASVPGMICTFRRGVDGTFSMPMATEAIRDFYGVSPEDVREDFTPALRRVHPGDVDLLRESIEASARHLKPWKAAFRVRHEERGELWLAGHSVPRQEGDGSIVWHGFVQDVTEVRKMEQEREAALVKYRVLFESFPLGITVADGAGRILESNKLAEELLGLAPEEHHARDIGSPLWKIFRPDGQPMSAEEYASVRALREGRVIRDMEMGLQRSKGDTVWLSVTAAPVPLPEVGVVITYTDITKRHLMEAQLRQSQKLEAVGHLAGGVAHDFNNILASAMINLELLHQDASLGHEAREILRELESESRRAADLTRQLLLFSRRSVLSVRHINLNEVVENLLKMLRRLIREQVEVVFTEGTAQAWVRADASLMEQVVLNLAVNARDAMPQGGRLMLQTERVTVEANRVLVNPESYPGIFVCLSIADTGVGMDAETLDQLFEPFFTTKGPGKGTGLGLATVHGIVGQHRGWIEVESQVGRGSVFRVYLPAVEGGVVGGLEPAHGNLESLRGRETLLVVEDEPAVRRSLSQVLRSLGYRVLEAGNSRQALEIWEREREAIDLLLTDMVMPGSMTGWDLSMVLLKKQPGLRVVLCSGYSEEIARFGQWTDPRFQYLSKPFDVHHLGATLRRSLGSVLERV